MTAAEIAGAEEAVRELVGREIAELARPALRPGHALVVEMIERLPWTVEPTHVVAGRVLTILTVATMPGGPLDPAHDDADLPWAITLMKLVGTPSVGSTIARAWYRHGLHLLLSDVEVSTVVQSVAAYTIASFEDALGNHHEVGRWLKIAAVEGEIDDRPGVSLAVALRAARLLAWERP
jgi:hypothetical protein